ncbi:uncharacterized protein [Amphiura filiformis]|uniref:uncharacterized protein n=1 Tax=Amphiura filiformis TaxID=82378 RepID=UPI003B218DE9
MGASLLKNKLHAEIANEGAIHMLNVDTLLVIFNYLSLYDKLIAMRVNKEWCQIIKNHAWSVIDFRDKGPIRKVRTSWRQYRRFVSNNGPSIFEYRECGNEWQFPENEDDVLKFTRLYAGVGLQEIYLTVVSDEIMSYLRDNCPNIHSLGIRKEFGHIMKDNIYFPPKLQRLDLSFTYSRTNQGILFITCLEKCPHLRKVTFYHRIYYDPSIRECMKKLSEMTRLCELDIVCTSPFNMKDENLFSTIGSLTSLTRFTLKLYKSYEIDNLVRSIAHWTRLKTLTLVQVKYTRKAFEMMISGILNLESLEIGGIPMPSSSVVNLIGIHLLKLKSLKLTYLSSCESLHTLNYHPTLESLEIRLAYGYFCTEHIKKQEEGVESCVRRVYDVLVTLPNIRKVKIIGYNLQRCFSQEKYPVIKSAEIEVVDGNKGCNYYQKQKEKKLKRNTRLQIDHDLKDPQN